MSELPTLPPYVYGRECGENEKVIPLERVEVYAASAAAVVTETRRFAVEQAREAFTGNIEAVDKLGLDAMQFNAVFTALHEGEISTGRARELLRCWVLGTYSHDMLPPCEGYFKDDEFPIEAAKRLTAERDALRAALERVVTWLPVELDMDRAGWAEPAIGYATQAYAAARAALKWEPSPVVGSATNPADLLAALKGE